jgi:hypothetical protein
MNEANSSPIQNSEPSITPTDKTLGPEEIWPGPLVNADKHAIPQKTTQAVKKSIKLTTDLKFVVGRREMDQHLMIAASRPIIITRKKHAATAAGVEGEELFTSTQLLRRNVFAAAGVSGYLLD